MYKSVLFIFFLIHAAAGTQAIFGAETVQSQIRITASTPALEIPQNHLLPFTVTIEWSGEAGKYDIDDFENPQFTNFSIKETGSSNRVEERSGTLYTVKEFIYQLQPLELGMGYIDGVIVKYTDTDLDRSDRVVTKRIAVEVTTPVYPRDWRRIGTVTGGGAVFIILLLSAALIMRKRRMTRVEEPETVILEDVYLERLKSVAADHTGSLNEKLGTLSRDLRKYLAEKYELESAGLGVSEMMGRLSEHGIDENQQATIKEVMDKSDVYKFSGQSIDVGEYELLYTRVLSIIERNKAEQPSTTIRREED